jgi:hypothetical protein
MDRTYWHRQTKDKPLYPDLIWSRPENKAHAGKLLIAGGNLHGFAAPAEALTAAEAAGIGSTRVLLPLAVQKLLPKGFMEMEFAASTPSGSFSRQALGELLSLAEWSDGILLAGNFGRNSETAILLEQFVDKYKGQLTLTKDTLDFWLETPALLLQRDNTLLVASFSQLQKMATAAHFSTALTSEMGLLKLVDTLHEFSGLFSANIITRYESNFVAAVGGEINTTPSDLKASWCIRVAAQSATWWLQHPTKPFEALSSSLIA